MSLPLRLLLPLALSATLAQAAPLTQTQGLDRQVLLPGFNPSISDAFDDAAAPTLVHLSTPSFDRFDANAGVLVGVRGSLSIDAAQRLMAYRGLDGGRWDSTSTVRGTWSLDGGVLATSGSGWLGRAVADRDNPVVFSDRWGGLSFATSTALDRFVGTGVLGSGLNVSLSSLKEPGSGGSAAIAAIEVADSRGFTGSLQLQYDYLQHAQVSFDGAVNQTALALDLLDGPLGFGLFGHGDAGFAAADLVDVRCSGACDDFVLEIDTVDGLVAGASRGGLARFLGDLRTGGAAHYVLTLADDDAVGAAASRRTHELVLDLFVHAADAGPDPAAVPAPGTAALAALALGLAGLYRARTGAGRLPRQQRR